MNNRPGLGLRFRSWAIATLIATLLIALPSLAQQDQVALPRLATSSQLWTASQASPPSQQGQSAPGTKKTQKRTPSPQKKGAGRRRPPRQTTGYFSPYRTS